MCVLTLILPSLLLAVLLYFVLVLPHLFFFFFTHTAPTEIYTLSLHDALPISPLRRVEEARTREGRVARLVQPERDCARSEEHTSELQSHSDLVCRLLLEKKKQKKNTK